MDRRTFLLSPLALWGCGGSGGDIMSNASNLGSLPTTQGTAFTFTPGGYPLNTFYQQPNELMFADAGAAINRINDRLFIADATKSGGTSNHANQNWLEVFYSGTSNGTGSYTDGAMVECLTNDNSYSGIAAIFGGQALHNAQGGCIGLMGFALHNAAVGGGNAYALYAEAHRMNATGNQTVGFEVEVRNVAAAMTPTNPWQQSLTVGMQIGSGAGMTATNTNGAAIQIWNNPNSFAIGMVFGASSLAGATGDGSGFATAIAMALGHGVAWYNVGGGQAGNITSTCTNGNATLNMTFGINRISFGDNQASHENFRIARVANANNFLQMVPATSGSPPYVNATGDGTDGTNIDLMLRAAASGFIRFGLYQAGTFSQTGYITIKDDAGTTRRLMVG
jgi:hypothetical protein